MRSGLTSCTTRRTFPSSIRRLLPGLSAAKISGCGMGLQLDEAVSTPHKRHVRAALELPLAAELAEAQFRALEIDQDRDRPPDLDLDAAHGVDQRFQVGVRRVGSY